VNFSSDYNFHNTLHKPAPKPRSTVGKGIRKRVQKAHLIESVESPPQWTPLVQSPVIDYTPHIYENSSYSQGFEQAPVEYTPVNPESAPPVHTTPDPFIFLNEILTDNSAPNERKNLSGYFHFLREDLSENPLWLEGHDRQEIQQAISKQQKEHLNPSGLTPDQQEVLLNIGMAQAGYFDTPDTLKHYDQEIHQEPLPDPNHSPNLEHRLDDPFLHPSYPYDPFMTGGM